MRFPRLFEAIRIGSRTAKNRVMRLATVTNLAESSRIGERMIVHYRTVAEGGAGTIVIEALRVHASDAARPTFVTLFDPAVVPGLRRLADAVHAEDALLIAQLYHGGRQHLGRMVPTMWAPSAIACPYSGGVPHQMTTAEVHDVVAGFVRSALHARDGGVDGVEVHGAQGHLIQQFVSPFSNQRRDAYGGSFENRLRFPREIIAGIREQVGRDLIVGYRMGTDEFTPGGLTIDDSARIAGELAADGLVDYLSLSQGNFNSIDRHLPDRHSPPATFVEQNVHIKAAAGGLPVVTSGRIETPEQAETIIASGKADLVGLCRPLIVDPDWPRKALEGRPEDIRYCISCNQCWGWVTDGRTIGCVCNARAGREIELGPLHAAPVARRVVVAGGGPSGLEAARVAAERGHRVTILEQSDALGGKVRLTEHVPHDEEMRRVIDYLIGQVEKLGVKVRLETEATPATVAAEQPDAVIVATGAIPVAPDVPGDGSVAVSTSSGALLVGMLPGDHVVVMDEDGYYWAAAVIETVAGQGKKVTVVTRFFEILRELPAVSRISALRALDEQGVAARPHTYVDRIEQGAVVLKDCYTGREETIPGAAAVIWVGPQEAQGSLAETLRASGIDNVRVVGDAFAPRRLANAIEDGHRAGRAI